MKNLNPKTRLLHVAILIVAITAAILGMATAATPTIMEGSQAYAQEPTLQPPNTSSNTTTTTSANGQDNATEAVGEPLPDPLKTNATMLHGEIGSIQSAHQQIFSWSTAGDWAMRLDGPMIGRPNPQIESFNATVHMVRLDGNVLHRHEISNFTQYSVSHTGDAVTTFNGTFTVTMREGTVHDVPGYIQFVGDLIGIWLDPRTLDNHFGSTPVYGMVLPQEEPSGPPQ